MGGGGSSHSEQVRKRDPYTPEMLAMDAALYNQFMPMYQTYGDDLGAADKKYASYGDAYDKALSGMTDLTTTGKLPAGMTDEFNNYLNRETQRSLGAELARLAGTGTIQSSMADRSIRDISSTTADAFAKNYSDLLGQTSTNYGTLMSGARDAQTGIYSDLNNKYAGAFNYWQQRKQSEDLDDYDTVIHNDPK